MNAPHVSSSARIKPANEKTNSTSGLMLGPTSFLIRKVTPQCRRLVPDSARPRRSYAKASLYRDLQRILQRRAANSYRAWSSRIASARSNGPLQALGWRDARFDHDDKCRLAIASATKHCRRIATAAKQSRGVGEAGESFLRRLSVAPCGQPSEKRTVKIAVAARARPGISQARTVTPHWTSQEAERRRRGQGRVRRRQGRTRLGLGRFVPADRPRVGVRVAGCSS